MSTAPYEVVGTLARISAFNAATKPDRKALLQFFEQLARQPSIESDWTLIERARRINFQVAVGRCLVTYWPDHAAREVRILR